MGWVSGTALTLSYDANLRFRCVSPKSRTSCASFFGTVRTPCLYADASVAPGAAENVRAGAIASDPIPTPTGSYAFAAKIGGTSVDRPGEVATIHFFAEDSNDSTFSTTASNPI